MKSLIILLLVIIPISLKAIDKRLYYSYGNKFDATSFNVLDSDSDSMTVFIMFRILNDNLNFIKSSSSKELYKAEPKIEMLFKDNDGVIRSRSQWSESIVVNDYVKTISKKDYLEGFIKKRLLKGSYVCEIEYLKRASKNKKIELKISDRDFSSILFLAYNNNNYRPQILNNGSNFSSKGPTLLIPTRDSKNLTGKIKKLGAVKNKQNESEEDNSKRLDKSIYTHAEIEFDFSAELLNNQAFEISQNSSKLDFNFSGENNNSSFYKIDLSTEKMIPGEYVLIVDGKEYFRFNHYWNDKPLSLINIDFAINNMYYLLDDDAFDNLKSGSEKRQFEKFLHYWNLKDPTPNTPFNEAMMQYFERVDYAFFNYQTLAQKDGVKTDRGKIYILNGPPNEIKKKKKGSTNLIIWNYENYKEEYVFEMIVSGVYKLVEINKTNQTKKAG